MFAQNLPLMGSARPANPKTSKSVGMALLASEATVMLLHQDQSWPNASEARRSIFDQGCSGERSPYQEEMGSQVELVEIEGAGHALLSERPEEIATAVVRFLKRLSGDMAGGAATISV